jgi:hypothetical protein
MNNECDRAVYRGLLAMTRELQTAASAFYLFFQREYRSYKKNLTSTDRKRCPISAF